MKVQGRFIVMALLAGLLLTGCGSRTKYKYRIAVIPKGLTHEFWQSIHRGADRAAADLASQKGIAVEILWDGPRKESDSLEQANIIHQKSAMNIHGLVLAPQDKATMVSAVEAARKRQIKVVIIDSDLKDRTLYEKYVATNNYRGGQLAARHLLKVLEDDGIAEPKLVLLRYAAGSESTEQREQGFLDEVATARKAGRKIEILSENQYAGATVETAEKAAQNLLSSLEKQRIDGMFVVNESATAGMLNALRSAGRDSRPARPRFVGFDSSRQLLKALREDKLDALIIQDPYYMGYMGVWTVVMALEGQPYGKEKKELTTGEYILVRGQPDHFIRAFPDLKGVYLNVDSREAAEKFDPDIQKDRKITPRYD